MATNNSGVVAGSRYELLVKVAVGGTATVFAGRQRGLSGMDDLVAIKRMHPYLSTEASSRQQMAREAAIAQRVVHENLVRIHELERVEDELLLVMEYVEGGSLAELLAAGPLGAQAALGVILDAARGLSALHEVPDGAGQRQGFVHRDVSPQNILVGLDGVAKLGDFGLVKRTDVSTTHTTVLRGKVAYMAPEQVEGQRATQRSDIFALGVVAWEVFARERLFRGANDADTMRRVLACEVPALSKRSAALPTQLDGVLRQALARDPKARFASVPELIRALERAFSGRAPADREDIGATVRAALGEALDVRRETLSVMLDPHTTVSGMVDLSALVAQPADPASPDTVDDDAADDGTAAIETADDDTTVDLDATALSAQAVAALHTPTRYSAPRGLTTVAVAVVAAGLGALGMWVATRPSAPPRPSAEPATATSAHVDEEAPASSTSRASTAPTAASSSSRPRLDAPSDATPRGRPGQATESEEPPSPRSGRRAPAPTSKSSAAQGPDRVVVPDNPYR